MIVVVVIVVMAVVRVAGMIATFLCGIYGVGSGGGVYSGCGGSCLATQHTLNYSTPTTITTATHKKAVTTTATTTTEPTTNNIPPPQPPPLQPDQHHHYPNQEYT